jgi:phosphoethanolamine N-methyltransferase
LNEDREQGAEYTGDAIEAYELRWGEGFLSPGGAEEVARMLEGADLRGREVLDIGCGVGGADVVLVRDHGAGHVLGIDVERPALDRAAARAESAGLTDRLSFQLVAPGPLPFAAAAFDVVFSKEAIIHVADKAALFAEVLRVLRPGGGFVVSDWFRSSAPFSEEMTAYVESGHLTFNMETLEATAETLRRIGFAQVTTRDRHAWYRERAHEELARAEGPDRQKLAAFLGAAEAEKWIARMRAKAVAVDQGHLRPGHIHAITPAKSPAD